MKATDLPYALPDVPESWLAVGRRSFDQFFWSGPPPTVTLNVRQDPIHETPVNDGALVSVD
jgi:hypothetical protein